MKNLILIIACFAIFPVFTQKSYIKGHISNPYRNYILVTSWIELNGQKQEIVIDSVGLIQDFLQVELKLDSLSELILSDGINEVSVYLKPNETIHFSYNSLVFKESLIFSEQGSERNNYLLFAQNKKFRLFSEINEVHEDITPSDTSELNNYFKKEAASLSLYAENGLLLYPEFKKHFKSILWSSRVFIKGFAENINYEMALFNLKQEVLFNPTLFLSFEGINLEGDTIKLESFFGKPIVLDFWATWCGPCVAEFPSLKILEDKYASQIHFLKLCVLDDLDKWSKHPSNKETSNSVFIDKLTFENLKEKYLIRAIPRFMILDAQGNLINVDAFLPSDRLESQIQLFLKE